MSNPYKSFEGEAESSIDPDYFVQLAGRVCNHVVMAGRADFGMMYPTVLRAIKECARMVTANERLKEEHKAKRKREREPA